MNLLLKIRNTVEEYYIAHRRVVGYIIRTVVLFLCMFTISRFVGFHPMLSETWFVVVLSLVFGFVPIRFIMIGVMAYTTVQVFTLSYGLGIVTCTILVVMYLLFFRYASKFGYLLILLPVLYFLKIPLVAVLALAAMGPAISVITVLFGTVYYYLLHYIDVHAVTFSSSTGELEFSKGELLLQGVFGNREMLAMLGIMFIVFMIVHFVKRANFSRSYEIAITIGSGVYIILTLASELLFGSLTSGKLITYVVSGLVCGVAAILITTVLKPLDYSRTETVEFEDEEYNYYVKAVPKVAFKTETVSVKRINKRKKS